MADKETTLERLVPDLLEPEDATGRETLLLHLERYRFAARYVQHGARVLDIACGVGYGTRLMADLVSQQADFTGVDISAESVAYARSRYQCECVRYVTADAMTYYDPDGFDVVVSLETIEHLPEPSRFITSINRSLKPRGLFIGSVPTTPSVDANPHHLHDFSRTSFRKLLREAGLQEIDALEQVQRFSPFAVVTKSELRLKDMRQNLFNYYITHPRALVMRVGATLIHGFNNKYLTVVAQSGTQ